MVGWIFGALVAAAFAAFGGAQVVVLISERGPTTLSCRAFLEERTTARWVRLSGCVAVWERARLFSERRMQRGLYVPLVAEGMEPSDRLLARIDARADRATLRWEGLLDVRAADDRPAFAAPSTRILYVHRPDPAEIVLAIAAPLLYAFAARVALRRRRLRRAALAHLLRRFTPRVGPLPAALEVLHLDPLLHARRTINRGWPFIAATLALQLSVVAAQLLKHGSVPLALSLAALAAPAVVGLGSALLWRRLPTLRRLALVATISVLLAVLLVLSLTSPGAPTEMAGTLMFLPAPLAVAFTMLKRRKRLLEHPDWVRLAAVDAGVTRVSAQRLTRHESIRRRPVRITLYRIAALATVLLGVLVAAVVALSIVAGIGGAVGIAIWRRARRHASLDAREVSERDPRAPVALLRSFADDNLELRGLPELTTRPSTLTWLAAEKLATVGPVVAVGEPGEGLPPLGPYRLFLPAGQWREEVEKLIAGARAVYLVLGRSLGVRWELERLVHQPPGRATLIVPSAEPDDLERRWENLLILTKDQPAWRLAEHLDPTRVILFRPLNSEAALAVTASRPDGKAYALALSICAAIEVGFIAANPPRHPSLT